jgi:hypothetical protein
VSRRRAVVNGSFIESHRECMTPQGPVAQLEVFGYSARRGLYLYWGFNARVVSTYTSPSLNETIVWTGEVVWREVNQDFGHRGSALVISHVLHEDRAVACLDTRRSTEVIAYWAVLRQRHWRKKIDDTAELVKAQTEFRPLRSSRLILSSLRFRLWLS